MIKLKFCRHFKVTKFQTYELASVLDFVKGRKLTTGEIQQCACLINHLETVVMWLCFLQPALHIKPCPEI